MTVRPIIFSGPMVRALLEGRKTQTRRVLKQQPDTDKISGPYHPEPRGGRSWVFMARDDFPEYSYATADFTAPYAVRDLLYVGEAWRTEARYDSRSPRDVPRCALTSYEADYDCEPNDGCRGRYRHARFMPRWASRLTLEVTGVKVERLQGISEDDAGAEGVYTGRDGDLGPLDISARALFKDLWQEINAKRASWDSNPWVVAVTFNVIHRNVDALLAVRKAA